MLLRRNKLPLSLLQESTTQPKVQIVQTESFNSTFGPKATRKRPKLSGQASLSDLAGAVESTQESYDEKLSQDQSTADGKGIDWIQEAREAVFSKGQSKRIWNELYKVIDSSDVLINVLDARDPMGTRCRAVESYLKKEAPYKHLIFVLNKCDLVPTWVAVSSPFPSSTLLSANSHILQLHRVSQGPFAFIKVILLQLWKINLVSLKTPRFGVVYQTLEFFN